MINPVGKFTKLCQSAFHVLVETNTEPGTFLRDIHLFNNNNIMKAILCNHMMIFKTSQALYIVSQLAKYVNALYTINSTKLF